MASGQYRYRRGEQAGGSGRTGGEGHTRKKNWDTKRFWRVAEPIEPPEPNDEVTPPPPPPPKPPPGGRGTIVLGTMVALVLGVVTGSIIGSMNNDDGADNLIVSSPTTIAPPSPNVTVRVAATPTTRRTTTTIATTTTTIRHTTTTVRRTTTTQATTTTIPETTTTTKRVTTTTKKATTTTKAKPTTTTEADKEPEEEEESQNETSSSEDSLSVEPVSSSPTQCQISFDITPLVKAGAVSENSSGDELLQYAQDLICRDSEGIGILSWYNQSILDYSYSLSGSMDDLNLTVHFTLKLG